MIGWLHSKWSFCYFSNTVEWLFVQFEEAKSLYLVIWTLLQCARTKSRSLLLDKRRKEHLQQKILFDFFVCWWSMFDNVVFWGYQIHNWDLVCSNHEYAIKTILWHVVLLSWRCIRIDDKIFVCFIEWNVKLMMTFLQWSSFATNIAELVQRKHFQLINLLFGCKLQVHNLSIYFSLPLHK